MNAGHQRQVAAQLELAGLVPDVVTERRPFGDRRQPDICEEQ